MQKKLAHDLKNHYKAKTIEKDFIDRTWLIEYNRVRSYFRIYKLMNNRRKIVV